MQQLSRQWTVLSLFLSFDLRGKAAKPSRKFMSLSSSSALGFSGKE